MVLTLIATCYDFLIATSYELLNLHQLLRWMY